LKWLNAGSNADTIGASYVYPPVGGWGTHWSGIENDLLRECPWDDATLVQEGTRRLNSAQYHRQVKKYQKSGHVESWGGAVRLGDQTFED